MASRLIVALVGGLSGDRNTSVHSQRPATSATECVLTFVAGHSYNVEDKRLVHLVSWVTRIVWWIGKQVGQSR